VCAMLESNHSWYPVKFLTRNAQGRTVLRYKYFYGAGAELEGAINSWLAEYEPEVTSMTQTALNDNWVAISFLFEESFRAQELRLEAESGSPHHVAPAILPGAMPDRPLEVHTASPIEGIPEDRP
jgi:hypothetical protein